MRKGLPLSFFSRWDLLKRLGRRHPNRRQVEHRMKFEKTRPVPDSVFGSSIRSDEQSGDPIRRVAQGRHLAVDPIVESAARARLGSLPWM